MRTVNPMGLFICFKGKQLERRGAKQSNEKKYASRKTVAYVLLCVHYLKCTFII